MPAPPPTPPIVICGFPRTGTTFLRELLNSHPDVHISIEYRLRALFATRLLCAQSARLHQREHEGWRGLAPDEARVAMLRAVWYYSEPEGLLARRYGNKTPGNERHFRFFERVFHHTPPLYIYTMRDPAEAIASYRRMPWGDDKAVWRLIAQLGGSLRAFRRFQKQHRDRVLPVALDRATTENGKRALVEEVFQFIGERPTAEVWRFTETWPVVNPSARNGRDTAMRARLLDNRAVRYMRRDLGYA